MLDAVLEDAADLGISIEATPWSDALRAWRLSSALRYADAVSVAAAERMRTVLLTADARIERSGAPFDCEIRTVAP